MSLTIEQKEQLYFREAKKILPLIEFSSSFSFGSTSSAEIQLSTRNELFNSFIENNKVDSYIHYTSIHSFCEIINSGHIRMYNCNNLNDSKEIEYAIKKFGLKTSHYELENYKRSHFVFSSCIYNHQKLDDFNMWRFYGGNGTGVGIVYKIEYGDENYKNLGINIGNVNYGEDNEKIKLFKKYIDFHIEFDNKHRLFNNKPSLFPLIAGFFKDSIWGNENESRILAPLNIDEYGNIDKDIFKGNYNQYLIRTVEATINSRGKKVYYMKLPLKKCNVENQDRMLNICPKIKIEKVIFGYDISEETKNELMDFINYELHKKLGYHVKYEVSKIMTD